MVLTKVENISGFNDRQESTLDFMTDKRALIFFIEHSVGKIDSLLQYIYEGQSISNETFLITQVCNDW